jgi:hypothetical protein
LAGGEAEGLGAGAPPAARGLTAFLARLDVIRGRVQCQGRVDLLPDVVQVVALAQGADDSQGLPPLGGDGGTVHDHQMVHGCDALEVHGLRMAKWVIKIENEGGKTERAQAEPQESAYLTTCSQ